jgi:hypothetical protein
LVVQAVLAQPVGTWRLGVKSDHRLALGREGKARLAGDAPIVFEVDQIPASASE